MNRRRLLSLIISFMLVIGFCRVPAMAAEETVHLTILGTTDVHGNIYNWSYEDQREDNVGFAMIYSVVKAVREENPNTILLDNGDTIQGTILTDDLYNTELVDKPHPVIDVMNFMGYDAMTLGNHEFNFGTDLIDKLAKEAEFPILGANIYNKKDGSNFVKPYTVKEIAGVKVGILGFTTPNIPRWDGSKVTHLQFEPMHTAAQKYIKELKEKEGVDIIIVTCHAGLDGEYDSEGGDSVRKLIETNPEIEVALIGHDHKSLAETVGNTVVGGVVNGGKEVVRFDIYLKNDGQGWQVTDKTVQLIDVSQYGPSEELREYAKEYQETTLEFIKEVIGYASGDFHPESEVKDIPEAQIRDTALIDLINNVQLKYSGADISAAALFQNTSDLNEGPITYANLFDIYKYPNTLKVVEVTGKELKDYMEWSVKYYNTFKPGDVTISFDPNIRGYMYDMFQGVEYKIDISKPAGERIVDLKFKGEPVKPDDKFTLALNDYRLSVLTGTGVFPEKEVIYDSSPKSLRSMIADFIREKGTIDPEVDNNWEIIGVDYHPLRDYIISEYNKGALKLPEPEDGRTYNTKSLNAYELIEQGAIPEEVLKEYGIIVEEPVEEEPVEKPEEKPVEKPVEQPKDTVYVVKPGDVLWKIAKKFNTTWQRLAEYNKLKNPHLIFPGQKILVPAN